MYNRIDALCKERRTNVTAMCRELGIARSSLSELKQKRTKSLSYEYISKIAAYFGVDPDYIAGKTDVKKAPATMDEREIGYDDFTYAFLDESKELTEDNKQKLLEMARFFKQQQDKDEEKNK